MNLNALRLSPYIELARNGYLRVCLIDLRDFLHDMAMYIRKISDDQV